MHHNIPKLLSPIAGDAHVHHLRQHSGKIPKLVTHPLIRGVGDGRAEGRLRGGKLRHGDRRRDEEKRTRREETTQTPPKLHSLTVSASCPTSDTHHNASRQSISTLPSTLPHRISISHQVIQVTGTVRISVGRRIICCSTGCTCIPTGVENRSGGDRAEWTPMTERVGGIPLPNQIWAETPGMHQMKPHPRSSLRSSRAEEVLGHPEHVG
jgi:hypothetical protein